MTIANLALKKGFVITKMNWRLMERQGLSEKKLNH
jgi:hypothetical protein